MINDKPLKMGHFTLFYGQGTKLKENKTCLD